MRAHRPNRSALTDRSLPRAQVAEIQRSRLIAAAVRAVEELGYTDATVAEITTRARVSRRTFYDLFANREECLAEVLEEAIALIENELRARAAPSAQCSWRDRVGLGLWVILSFLDREPVLARVCVVQAQQGTPATVKCREEILARLAAVVDEGRLESPWAADLTPMIAEGLVGAAFAIVHARLSKSRTGSLRALFGELMGMIVLPYQGASAAREEQARPAPAPITGPVRRFVRTPPVEGDPLDGIPMRLTYRTARVLEAVGERSGASNRVIAEHAGIADQGQVSKLLARLDRLGLLANRSAGHLKGEPNAWELTARGELITRSIRRRRPRTGSTP